MTGVSIVQHKSQINGNAVPGTFTLTSTPTPGNVIVAFVGMNISIGSFTYNSTDWTRVDFGTDPAGTTFRSIVLMRIVQSGDTSTLPAFATAGSTYSCYGVYELTGQYGSTVDDALLCCFIQPTHGNADGNIPKLKMFRDGNMALAFSGVYNGTVDPTISGSWTRDEHGANAALYGSIGCASRAMNTGDAVDGAWTISNSEPMSSAVVVIRSDNTQGFYPRHFYSRGATGGAGSVNVGWTPKPGNLLLAWLDWDRGSSGSPPTISGSWTEYAHADNSNRIICALQRTVQIGDTNAMPAITSAGSDFHAVSYMEIESPTAAFADHVSDKTGYAGSGSGTQTTTSDTTTANDQIGILHSASYNNTAQATEGSGWFFLQSLSDFSDYGSFATFLQFFPTSGSTVQATITNLNSGDSKAYTQHIFQGPSLAAPGTLTYRINLIESGVPENGVDILPATVYQWHGQIFTKNPTNNPITRSDFNSMLVQVERTH